MHAYTSHTLCIYSGETCRLTLNLRRTRQKVVQNALWNMYHHHRLYTAHRITILFNRSVLLGLLVFYRRQI